MKKAMAILVAGMILMVGAAALATGTKLTVEDAKQLALGYANVRIEDTVFVRAELEYEDGRLVYDIKFYAGELEYEMDVDAQNGRVTDYSVEYIDRYDRDDHFDHDDRFDWD